MQLSRVIPVLALLVSCLGGGVLTAVSADAVPPPDDAFVPRWCSATPTPPCLESASRNGTPVAASDPTWQVEMTGDLKDAGDAYFQFVVSPADGAPSGTVLSTTDTWALTFDTGPLEPTYTEGYAGQPVVDRSDDGDGTYQVTYDAKPVLTTDGCDVDQPWPWPCSTVATDWRVELSGEVWDRPSAGAAWAGFDRSQSVDGVNGIFLETSADGSRYLSSEMVNSHQYDDGGVLKTFEGEAHFRIPYVMLRDEFDVPNPATMVASSLTGSVNGSTTSGTWTIFNDTSGKAMVVDVSDLTFSVKRLKVRRGVITPTRPTQMSATRTGRTRGFVDFDPSRARGAKVTGYAGRCVAAHGDQVVTAESGNIVRFTGLRARVPYDCRVRATSAAGPSAWSEAVRMSAGAVDPG